MPDAPVCTATGTFGSMAQAVEGFDSWESTNNFRLALRTESQTGTLSQAVHAALYDFLKLGPQAFIEFCDIHTFALLNPFDEHVLRMESQT